MIDPRDIVTEHVYDSYELDPAVEAVIVGIDPEWTHQKICLASLYIQERKVPLIVSSYDMVGMVNGRNLPGDGALL